MLSRVLLLSTALSVTLLALVDGQTTTSQTTTTSGGSTTTTTSSASTTTTAAAGSGSGATTSTADTTTSDPLSTTTSFITSTTNFVMTTLTPQPTTIEVDQSTIVDTNAYFNVVFTSFAQDAGSLAEYRRVISVALNVAISRINYQHSSTGVYGYPYGSNVLVPMYVSAPSSGDTLDAPTLADRIVRVINAPVSVTAAPTTASATLATTTATTTTAATTTTTTAATTTGTGTTDLTTTGSPTSSTTIVPPPTTTMLFIPYHVTAFDNIGIVAGQAQRVYSLTVFQYQALTTWDVLWTLLIISGGLAVLCVIGFILYRIVMWRRAKNREEEMDAGKVEGAGADKNKPDKNIPAWKANRDAAANKDTPLLQQPAYGGSGSAASSALASSQQGTDGSGAGAKGFKGQLARLGKRFGANEDEDLVQRGDVKVDRKTAAYIDALNEDDPLDDEEKVLLANLMYKLKHANGDDDGMGGMNPMAHLPSTKGEGSLSPGGVDSSSPSPGPSRSGLTWADTPVRNPTVGMWGGGAGTAASESHFTSPTNRPALTQSSGPAKQPVPAEVTQSAVHKYLATISLPPMPSDDPVVGTKRPVAIDDDML